MIKIFSYSALETYNNCPKKFQFAYIEKIPKDKRVNAITYLGNAVHRILQKLYKFGADNIILPKNKMLEMYLSEWSKLKVESIKLESDIYTVDDYIRIGQDMLINHYDKYAPFKPGVLIGAEVNLIFNLPGTSYKFRCVIDRLIKHNNYRIEICDYKTGQNISLPTSDRFFYQMGIYQLAVMENYPNYKEIDLVQHYLRKDEIVSSRLTTDQVEILKEQIRLAIEETKHASKLNNFPIKEGPYCSFCDYFDVCPAKIHNKLIYENVELTEGGISIQRIKELADKYISANQESRQLKAELDEIKKELTEIAKSENINSFNGEQGKVSLKISTEEKFITKTEEPQLFADLQSYCRQIGLDEFFKLDSPALMKEGIIKRRLSEDQIEHLKRFIIEKESTRFNIKLFSDYEQENDD